MSPVDRAGSVSENSPHLQVLCKIFDVFIWRAGWLGCRDLGKRLEILPYEHFIPVTGMNGGMNSGGPDGIVLHWLLYFLHHKHPI